MGASTASRVVLSFAPVEDGESAWTGVDTDWILDELTGQTYRTYLKRVREGPVAVGDEWDEFISCGCATPQDVRLRVEHVEGGSELGGDTRLSFQPRRPADTGLSSETGHSEAVSRDSTPTPETE